MSKLQITTPEKQQPKSSSAKPFNPTLRAIESAEKAEEYHAKSLHHYAAQFCQAASENFEEAKNLTSDSNALEALTLLSEHFAREAIFEDQIYSIQFRSGSRPSPTLTMNPQQPLSASTANSSASSQMIDSSTYGGWYNTSSLPSSNKGFPGMQSMHFSPAEASMIDFSIIQHPARTMSPFQGLDTIPQISTPVPSSPNSLTPPNESNKQPFPVEQNPMQPSKPTIAVPPVQQPELSRPQMFGGVTDDTDNGMAFFRTECYNMFVRPWEDFYPHLERQNDSEQLKQVFLQLLKRVQLNLGVLMDLGAHANVNSSVTAPQAAPGNHSHIIAAMSQQLQQMQLFRLKQANKELEEKLAKEQHKTKKLRSKVKQLEKSKSTESKSSSSASNTSL